METLQLIFKVFLIIVAMTIILVVAWVQITQKQFDRFQETMKPGDPCWIFNGEERLPGVIEDIFESEGTAHVSCYREIHAVNKEDIYPRLKKDNS